MAKQTLTAFYDSREYANNAVLMLRQAGVPDADVALSPDSAAADYAGAGKPPAKGFWAALEELFGGTDDHPTYTEGLRRGGIMLTAHVGDAKVEDAVRILEQHGSVDLDERETAWRNEGWAGNPRITGGGIANEGAGPLRSMTPVADTDAALVATRADTLAPVVTAAGVTGDARITGGGIANEGAGPLRSMTPVTDTDTARVATRADALAPVAVASATDVTGDARITGGGIANEGAGPLRSMTPVEETETTRVATRADALAATPPVAIAHAVAVAGRGSRDDVIQVVEETLNVGKRAVNRGKVRIHSYVVEKPVTETVSLRDETVTVDRRPVDRPVAAADLSVDAFKDRTIEMEEIDEEAVVAKTVRVVEEIGIRKEVTDSVKTITDTVRSTKVDIDDGRTGSGTAAALASVQKAANMEVVGSDGHAVGQVDHVDGTTIMLKQLDPASGAVHHTIPTDWVQSVDQKVRLKITAADAKNRWTAA